MITLLIDTSSSDVSIAILRNNKLIARKKDNVPNLHSIYTVKFIQDALEEAQITPKDINRIMVVTGPGSFTGLRIGVTIAKTYAYIENIDIIPISSLKMRAISTNHDNCLSIIDAHHNHYYIGLYNKENKEIIPEQYMIKDKVLDLIKEYNPKIVSDLDGVINEIAYSKQEIDEEKIFLFYDKEKTLNPHLVNPNYLKLPQALEVKND